MKTPPLAPAATVVAGLAGLTALLVSASTALGQSPKASLEIADLFPDDHILDVQITVADEDWDTIRRQTRKLRDALGAQRRLGPLDRPYTYVTADVVIDGVRFSGIGLRKKGFLGSQSARYPSLKIKLDHTDTRGGVGGLTKLTLNNNKQDLSLVSQYLTYRLFDRAGAPAPRVAFAKVTVNGKNLGVYTHVESVARPLCKLRFGSDAGTLYEGTCTDFFAGWEQSFEHKFGPTGAGAKKIDALTRALQRRAGPESVEAIAEHVDLDGFFRFWALEGLVCAWDGYSANKNNFFVYLHPTSGRFHFIPWGADCYFTNSSLLPRDSRAPLSVHTNSLLAHRLYGNPACRKRYRATLLEILDEHWKEKELLAELDRIQTMLAPHTTLRQSRFPRMLDGVRRFIRERRDDVLEEIEKGMPPWSKAPAAPFSIGRTAGRITPDSPAAAAAAGDVRTLRRLIRRGTKVNARNETGDSLLAIAAVAGRADAVRYLIKAGADLNSTSNENSVPLTGAAFLGRPEIVQILLDAGADASIRNVHGLDPLEVAEQPWSKEIETLAKTVSKTLEIQLDVTAVRAGRKRCAAILRKARR